MDPSKLYVKLYAGYTVHGLLNILRENADFTNSSVQRIKLQT